MERCILTYLSVQIQSSINDTSVLEYLRSKGFDVFLLLGMGRFVCRIKESLAIKLDSALNRRIDSAIDGSTQMLDASTLAQEPVTTIQGGNTHLSFRI
jgi:hypothetical protein